MADAARDRLIEQMTVQCREYPALIALWDAAVVVRVLRRTYRFGALYFDAGELALMSDAPGDDVLIYSARVAVPVHMQRGRVEQLP